MPPRRRGSVFFHFDFATYARMLRLARAEQNPAGRRRLYPILLAVIPIVSTASHLQGTFARWVMGLSMRVTSTTTQAPPLSPP